MKAVRYVSAASAVALLLWSPQASARAQRRPIPLAQGVQVGKTGFPAGDTDQGGHGQPVDGVEGAGSEMVGVHYHAHLSLFYQGEQMAVPYGIGIVQPFQVANGFVVRGQGFYWLHTHDATGIIHIESPVNRPFTLGNFFDIWGEPLKEGNVAGMEGTVRAYVGDQPYTGDPRMIRLQPHEQITIEVGEPSVTPPLYVFPKGL